MSLFCAGLFSFLGRAATFTVTTTADSGGGSLRQAILDSDANSETNTIIFQISGSPPFTITPLTALPSVGNPTLIDGTSQPGFAGTPVIELKGTSAGVNASGLQLLSSFNTVRGLAINRFDAQGIIVSGASNVIQGNYIGTDVLGATARANGSFGIWIQSAGNLIGGTNAGQGNVLSGNDTGIYVSASGGNTVQGNLIGISAAGTKALANGNNGVVLDNSSGNLIGGFTVAARNVISGNGQSGVYLNRSAATGNVIQGNYIGLNISGTATISNAEDGITLNGAAGNTIGSATAGGGNMISGNGFSGISIAGGPATGNLVLGNYIGTDATGKTALGNQIGGVTISSAGGNQLGGTNAGAGNVISGNKQDGIFLTGGTAANLIQGNLIGLSAAGTSALPNGFNGISLSSAISNMIGGNVNAARNVISGNTSNGIGILLVSDHGNSVLGNYIGADVTGLKAVANLLSGVRVQGCSNIIGGGNVISGNVQQGVWLVGASGNVTGNVIQGNVIGLDATGNGSVPNGGAGVGVSSAAGNQIGGTSPGAGNVISANGDAGIFFIGTGTTANQVIGNFIGTDASGALARGNALEGIYMERTATNQIGGGSTGAGNLISANHTRGLWLTNASWNVIQGNFIGTQADGSNALGNVFHNIELEANATNNLIGGTTALAGNHIAFAQSVYCGVRVRTGAFKNQIGGNSIFSNGALGIDLSPTSGGTAAGVNPIVDCESGVALNAANGGQNFPVLSDAYSGSGTRVRGTFDSHSGKTYSLQFFASLAGDASGYGEGQVFLGQTNLALGGACSASFTAFLPISVPANWVITATATSPANDTSEFSAWVSVSLVPALRIVSANTNQVSLAWTNNGGGFGLQQTYDLIPPAQWTAVAGAPLMTNGFYVANMPATNSRTFYRLVAQ